MACMTEKELKELREEIEDGIVMIVSTEHYEKMETIIEVIMTQHWDMAACDCWICKMGHEAACRPREKYLPRNLESLNMRLGKVVVERR